MKTIFSALLILFFILSVKAQVITIDEIVFSPGENVTVVFLNDDQSIAEGPSGQDQTWDFSEFEGEDTIVWRGEDPGDNSLGQELFPEAELAIRIPTPGNDTIDFEFYEFDSFKDDQIITLGSYAITTYKNTGQKDTSIIDNRLNPREDFQFPIEFGDEFMSDFNSIITTQIQDSFYMSRRGGTIEMTADATGTIITPVGTFENVVRVKRVETQMDTFTIEIMGTTFENINTTIIEYFDWMQPQRNFSVYRVIKTVQSFPGLPDQEAISAFYTFDVTSDLDDWGHITSDDVVVYPNPVEDLLSIESKNDLRIEGIRLVTVSGEVAREINPDKRTINFYDMPSGVYYLEILTAKGKYTQKLVKL